MALSESVATHNTVNPAASLVSIARSLLAALVLLPAAWRNGAEAARLMQLTDAELSARGIAREEIVSRAFGEA
ncbi:MAG: hypothetical protein AAF416_20855 [Pseudomonadota bacterium]